MRSICALKPAAVDELTDRCQQVITRCASVPAEFSEQLCTRDEALLGCCRLKIAAQPSAAVRYEGAEVAVAHQGLTALNRQTVFPVLVDQALRCNIPTCLERVSLLDGQSEQSGHAHELDYGVAEIAAAEVVLCKEVFKLLIVKWPDLRWHQGWWLKVW
jgi:hypothetical protein